MPVDVVTEIEIAVPRAREDIGAQDDDTEARFR
jgi:hypothetical protein